uniref:Lipoprotein n=1 Tax=Desulfobacca acetoxidans TaxID=60893 RepID=A0A7C3Z1E0_9BACT
MRRLICSLACVLAAFIAALEGCATLAVPPAPAGLAFQPGRYVQESYFAPGFNPEEATYTIGPFMVATDNEASSEAFQKIFQDELVRSWQAQGLKLGQGETACQVSGTIQRLSIQGERLRWLIGRLHAVLVISGTITRKGQRLFAFRDQISLGTPVAPGLVAPKEKDLLLRQLSREAAQHLLNELLLTGSRPGLP